MNFSTPIMTPTDVIKIVDRNFYTNIVKHEEMLK